MNIQARGWEKNDYVPVENKRGKKNIKNEKKEKEGRKKYNLKKNFSSVIYYSWPREDWGKYMIWSLQMWEEKI